MTFVVTGPATFTALDHHTVILQPTPMVIVPPRHYCIISNPVVTVKGTPQKDAHGQFKLRHGDEEVRQHTEPFPLYPGESLYGKVSPLQVVADNTALKLRAIRDCPEATVNGETVDMKAGDEWLFKGPGTYIPRVEVQVLHLPLLSSTFSVLS